MKTSQITFIQSSNKAKSTLFKNDLIPKESNQAVAKWLKTATDEEISSLAIDSDWTKETIIIPSAIAVTIPAGIKAVKAKIIDSKNRPQVVDAFKLPFKKTRTEDVYKKADDWETSKKVVKTGQKVLAFVFQFGEETIKTYSKMLEEAFRKGKLIKNDIVSFRADTCIAKHIPAKGDSLAYHMWEGATLEADTDVMQDARELTEQREAEFALLSKEGQQKVIELKSTREADAFLEKYA